MIVIRPMRPEDAEQVSAVDAVAFGAWWKQLRGEAAGDLARRTRTNVLVRLEKDPAGCFVAEEQDRTVGLIFSTTWGSVGWFGPFAVLPAHQGRGLGQRLLAASLEYLQRQNCRLIGLETMPESPNNVGLYVRQGFECRFLTLALAKTLGRPAPSPLAPEESVPGQAAPGDRCAGDGRQANGTPVSVLRWSAAAPETRARWLVELRRASEAIYPGLDYTKEIDAPVRHGLGEALALIEGGRAVGVSSVWLAGHREGVGQDQGSVQVLFLHPAHTDAGRFLALLAATENLAQAQDKARLALPVNTAGPWAVEQLLRWGYRVERTMVRMVRQGSDDHPAGRGIVELSRWAG